MLKFRPQDTSKQIEDHCYSGVIDINVNHSVLMSVKCESAFKIAAPGCSKGDLMEVSGWVIVCGIRSHASSDTRKIHRSKDNFKENGKML